MYTIVYPPSLSLSRFCFFFSPHAGMVDIARQTVEFLYEENGGIPRDLHLPTIEDIREDLAKFTIERVKKGTTVNIRTPASLVNTTGASLLPKFAVRAMLKTFGLTGTVLDIDTVREFNRTHGSLDLKQEIQI
jgi:E3 ubiquitin-protein ligase HECTD4